MGIIYNTKHFKNKNKKIKNKKIKNYTESSFLLVKEILQN
tara:strand:- start:581 stop:700 length:120 start_codon:yes stop_codon:yes gene_type:complete